MQACEQNTKIALIASGSVSAPTWTEKRPTAADEQKIPTQGRGAALKCPLPLFFNVLRRQEFQITVAFT